MKEGIMESNILNNAHKYKISGEDAYKSRAAARVVEYLTSHKGNISKAGLFSVAQHYNNSVIGVLRKWFGNSQRAEIRQQVALTVFRQIASDLCLEDEQSSPQQILSEYAREYASNNSVEQKVISLDFEDGIKFSYNLKTDEIVSISINDRTIARGDISQFFADLQLLQKEIVNSRDNSQIKQIVPESSFANNEIKNLVIETLKSLLESEQLSSLKEFRECNELRRFFNGEISSDEQEKTINMELVNDFSSFLEVHASNYNHEVIDQLMIKINNLKDKPADITFSQVTGIAFNNLEEKRIFQDYWISKNHESNQKLLPVLQNLRNLSKIGTREISQVISSAIEDEITDENLKELANVFIGGSDIEQLIEVAGGIKSGCGIIISNGIKRVCCYVRLVEKNFLVIIRKKFIEELKNPEKV